MTSTPCKFQKQPLHELKIEADFAVDPIWCTKCGYPIDVDKLPLSNQLKKSLIEWAVKYGEWMDWENDRLTRNGVDLENNHNLWGEVLTKNVESEWGNQYSVTFIPSESAQFYTIRDTEGPYVMLPISPDN